MSLGNMSTITIKCFTMYLRKMIENGQSSGIWCEQAGSLDGPESPDFRHVFQSLC